MKLIIYETYTIPKKTPSKIYVGLLKVRKYDLIQSELKNVVRNDFLPRKKPGMS